MSGEQMMRPSARERIAAWADNKWGFRVSRCTDAWCEAAERVIEAGDAREDALRAEIGGWQDAAIESEERAFRDRAELADCRAHAGDFATDCERLTAELAAAKEREAGLRGANFAWHERLRLEVRDHKATAEDLTRLSVAPAPCVECESKAREIERLTAELVSFQSVNFRQAQKLSVLRDADEEQYRERLTEEARVAKSRPYAIVIDLDNREQRPQYYCDSDAIAEAAATLAAIDAYCAAKREGR